MRLPQLGEYICTIMRILPCRVTIGAEYFLAGFLAGFLASPFAFLSIGENGMG